MKVIVKAGELISKSRWFWSVLLAFISCLGINRFLFDWLPRLFSNSLYSLMLFVVLIPAYAFILGGRSARKKIFAAVNRRTLCCSLVSGLIFSICMVFGRDLSRYGTVDYGDISVYLDILMLWPLFTAFMCFVLAWIEGSAKTYSPLIKKAEQWVPDWKYFMILWLIILLCWLPIFLAAYPGVYRYDAPYQTDYIMLNGRIWGHHPVIHTLYLTGSILLGNRLFSSYESGLAIYSVTQMLILSAIYAYACYYLAKRKAPVFIQLLSTAYFALVPFNAIMAVTATKDTLFAGFFLLSVLFTADLVRDQKHFAASKFELIRYVFVLISMCLWRNNGFYILVVFLPILIIVLRQYWKNLLIVSLAVIVLYVGYAGPMMEILNVVPGNSREALSVPMQQLARAALYAEDELTEEELASIHELISEDYVQRYNPRISDPVKNGFKTSALMKSPFKYLKTYLAVGIKCPDIYLDAFLELSLGNWYPDMIYPDEETGHQYIEYEDWTQAYENTRRSEKQLIPARESKLPTLDEWLTTYSLDVTQQEVPVLSMLISSGFMFFVIVASGAAAIYFKKYRKLLTVLLLLGLWGTIMLGPIALFRYSYPLMVCTPFLLYDMWECGARQALDSATDEAQV